MHYYCSYTTYYNLIHQLYLISGVFDIGCSSCLYR